MNSVKNLSPTFCSIAWIHLATTANGRAKMCCNSDREIQSDNGVRYSYETNSISEIWNSAEMREIRKKMLAGEKVEACKKCYYEESLGSSSMRTVSNEKWLKIENEAVLKRVEESQKNNFHLTQLPWYYDLRQGNLCNLKCRSCNPGSSVAIEKEYLKLSAKSKWFEAEIGHGHLSESFRSWFNNEAFNQQLIEQIPQIKKIYFTGGEPTLIQKNYELMQHCIDTGHAQNMELMFNTNLTNLNDRFLSLIKRFRNVILNLSIEGYGTEQEYMRGNTKWNLIEESLEKLSENHVPNLSYTLTPVIQATNVLSVDKLFRYLDNFNFKKKKNLFYIMPIILTDPAYLEMSILPEGTRQLAAERLSVYLKQTDRPSYDLHFEERIRQIIFHMGEKKEESPELIEKFIKFNITLDRERNQNFQEVFPELFSSWQKNSRYFDWKYSE